MLVIVEKDVPEVGGDLARWCAAVRALAAAPDVATIAGALAERGVEATRAAAAVVVLCTEDGASLELVASSGYDDAVLEPFRRFPIGAPLPIAEAVRERRQILITSREQLAARYPGLRTSAEEWSALGSFPLEAGGSVLGAVGLRFAAADVGLGSAVAAGEVLTAVAAERMAQARSRALLEQQVEQLQRALDSRVIIEQAKGVLSERHGISAGAAFERLRRHARGRGAPLRRVAEEVVAGRLRV